MPGETTEVVDQGPRPPTIEVHQPLEEDPIPEGVYRIIPDGRITRKRVETRGDQIKGQHRLRYDWSDAKKIELAKANYQHRQRFIDELKTKNTYVTILAGKNKLLGIPPSGHELPPDDDPWWKNWLEDSRITMITSTEDQGEVIAANASEGITEAIPEIYRPEPRSRGVTSTAQAPAEPEPSTSGQVERPPTRRRPNVYVQMDVTYYDAQIQIIPYWGVNPPRDNRIVKIKEAPKQEVPRFITLVDRGYNFLIKYFEPEDTNKIINKLEHDLMLIHRDL